MYASRYGRGESLLAQVDGPVYDCSAFEAVPTVDLSVVQGEDGSVTLLCVNRDSAEAVQLTGDLRSFGKLRVAEHLFLHHDDVNAVNTEAAPDTVRPFALSGDEVTDGRLAATLPALSWNLLRLVP